MARLRIACICLMTLAVAFGAPPANATPGVEDSAAGLRTQLEQILKAAQDRDSKRFESLVSDLQVPDDANWFVVAFGEEAGERLAARYKGSWGNYDDHLTGAFRDFQTEKNPRVEIGKISAHSKNAIAQPVVQNAKVPLQLYRASISTRHGGTAALPGIYIYVEGGFRVVNWYTLYGLPNVKPMRIRIGGNVAAADIVHPVTPEYPDETKGKQIQGTVVLHAIIGCDGDIQQVQFVSGPPELMSSAMDAVKQWRYKPTLLNGDPVEVDTTISVLYKLGH